MARQPNKDLAADKAIVTTFSIRRDLRDQLPVIARGVGLANMSELIQAVASFPEESQRALAGIAKQFLAQKNAAKTEKAEKAAQVQMLASLSPEQLADLMAKAGLSTPAKAPEAA